jgi:hypothetical protein
MRRTGLSQISPAVARTALTWPPASSARSSRVFKTARGPAAQVTVPSAIAFVSGSKHD